MVKFLGVIVLMILFIQCSNNPSKQTDHDFLVKINQICKVSDDTLKDWIWEAHFYSIDLSLENNTDSTIHFWINTCSWNDNFITNFQNIRIIGPLKCTRNFPTIRELAKNKKINYHGLIAIKDSFDLNNNVKVGFIYIRTNENDRLVEILPIPPRDSVQLRKHNTHDNIIWSDYSKIK
jgi:hypothetical protein